MKTAKLCCWSQVNGVKDRLISNKTLDNHFPLKVYIYIYFSIIMLSFLKSLFDLIDNRAQELFIKMVQASPLWETADAEMKDPSVENPELKCSPFNAWSRSEYSHTCLTCYEGFLVWINLYLPGPFIFIFSKTPTEVVFFFLSLFFFC